MDELVFTGREECAVALEAYWDDGGSQELVRILEFAQFPKPMGDGAQI